MTRLPAISEICFWDALRPTFNLKNFEDGWELCREHAVRSVCAQDEMHWKLQQLELCLIRRLPRSSVWGISAVSAMSRSAVHAAEALRCVCCGQECGRLHAAQSQGGLGARLKTGRACELEVEFNLREGWQSSAQSSWLKIKPVFSWKENVIGA